MKKSTSFNIEESVHERFRVLAANHKGNMSLEFPWLVTLGEIVMELSPDGRAIIEQVVEGMVIEGMEDEQAEKS